MRRGRIEIIEIRKSKSSVKIELRVNGMILEIIMSLPNILTECAKIATCQLVNFRLTKLY